MNKLLHIIKIFLVQEKLNDILNKNIETANSLFETKQFIENYQQGITDVLNPKFQELKREGDSRISLASEKRKIELYELDS
jgi:hypothetical protein